MFVVVLVLLLKLFVTEAFVIPTGSMAETLYGYQKVVTVPQVRARVPGQLARRGRSQPADREEALRWCGTAAPTAGTRGGWKTWPRARRTAPATASSCSSRSSTCAPPHRGDVVVFKYPDKPQENHIAANYIKRAMGFGGETAAIHRGDLYVTTALKYPDGPLFPRPDDPLDTVAPAVHVPQQRAGGAAVRGVPQGRVPGRADQQTAPPTCTPTSSNWWTRTRSWTAGKRLLDPALPAFVVVRKDAPQLLADRRVVWDNDKQAKELEGVVPPAVERGGRRPVERRQPPRQPRAFAHNGGDLDWLRYQHLVWKADPGAKRMTPWRWPLDGKEKPVAGPVDNMLGYNAGTDMEPGCARGKRGRTEPRRRAGRVPLGRRPDPGMRGRTGRRVGGRPRTVAGGRTGSRRSSATARWRCRGSAEKGRGVRQPDARVQGEWGHATSSGSPTLIRPPLGVGGRQAYRLRQAEGDYSPVEPAAVRTGGPGEGGVDAGQRRRDAPASIGARGAGRGSVKAIKLHRDVFYTHTRPVGDQTGRGHLLRPARPLPVPGRQQRPKLR